MYSVSVCYPNGFPGALPAAGRLAKSMADNMIPVALDAKQVIIKNQKELLQFRSSYIDSDGQQMKLSIVTQPMHGAVSSEEFYGSNAFTYIPAADFTGTDSFTWSISDGIASSNTATVRILVKEPSSNDGMVVLLVVNETLLPKINSEVTRLQTDLQNEGYTAKIKSWSGIYGADDGRELWEYLKSEYDIPSQFVSGAILIGDMPMATNSMTNEITDYAFMNMVEFRNVTYMANYTICSRQIWVSRICAGGGDEVKLVKRVLQANHDYRTGASRLPHTYYWFNAFLGDPSPEKQLMGITQPQLVWPVESANPTDAIRKGGEVLDEYMHGSELDYYIGACNRHPSQIRFALFTSCNQAGSALITNLTYGSGNIFSVGASADTSPGAFNITSTTELLKLLAAGESWGNTLVKRSIGGDVWRAMFFGDLSTRVKLYPANKLPVISSLTADKTTGIAPLTVNFTVSASDIDGAVSKYEWFVNGYNSGNEDPVYSTALNTISHTYTLPHRYLAEVQVLDNYLARTWKDVPITVGMQPNTCLRVNCGTSTNAYDSTQNYHNPSKDYLDHSGTLWLHDQGYADGTWGSKTTGEGAGEMSESDVEGTEEDTLYKWFRTTCCGYDENGLPPIVYAVPLENGIYTLNIGLADMLSSNAGERVMDVIVENDTIRKGLDVYALAGPRTAYVVSTKVEVKDGVLEFSLAKNPLGTEAPFINCFEVIPESWINRTSQLSVSSLSYGVQAFPNPFAGAASIKFMVPQTKTGERQSLSVRVYDLNGQLVRTLAQGQFAAGYHTVQLNARDKGKGYALCNGIYFCRMQAPGFTKTLKLLLVE